MKKFRTLSAIICGAAALLGGSNAFASAPPLTSLRVIYIASSTASETITAGQVTTTKAYGGNPVQVTVRQIGYSSNIWGYMRGSTSGVTLVNQTTLCGTAAAPTTCSVGQTAIGFDTVYQVSVNSTGQFSAKANNAVSPFNSLTTYLNIQ